jgi:hypothetical protein
MPDNPLKVIGCMVVAWLGYAYSASFVGTFPSLRYTVESLPILGGLLWFLFVLYSDISFDFYAGIICVFALLMAGIASCQLWWFDPVSTTLANVITVKGDMDFRTPVGVLGNPNFLGAYLAIALPFFFRRGWCLLIPVVAYGLWISQTSSAIGAALCGVGFFLFGMTGAVLAVVPAVAYFIIIDGHTLTGIDRIDFWMDAAQKVTASPSTLLFGYGQGATWQEGNQLHNQYASTLFHFGAVGLACMLNYIFTVYQGNRILFTAFLILCVNMIGNHPLHTVPTAILAITVIALIEREKSRP